MHKNYTHYKWQLVVNALIYYTNSIKGGLTNQSNVPKLPINDHTHVYEYMCMPALIR